jgi:Zn-dependent protease/predicted transcriptional regulator
MRWSWKIAQIRGIGIYVHFTFLLLLGWIVLATYLRDHDIGEALYETLFVVLVFAIIVLHELGHATAAARYGIATRDITLLPIGGVARLERMPEDPRQELIVALAGPAVNVIIAAGIFAGMVASSELNLAERAPQLDSLTRGPMFARLLAINIWLVIFNLIPAFPMDGGRVLRALLAMRMDYVSATQRAASIGQGIALLFGFIGLFSNPLLLFIALFVWIGAAQEAHLAQAKGALAGIPVAQVMVREFQVLAPEDTLGVAANHVLAGFQQDFPVVHEGKLVGLLTRSDLLGALIRHGETGQVAGVMKRTFEVAHPTEMLDTVMLRLQASESHALPVVRGDAPVGIVTMESLSEYLMLQSAFHKQTRDESLATPSGSVL